MHPPYLLGKSPIAYRHMNGDTGRRPFTVDGGPFSQPQVMGWHIVDAGGHTLGVSCDADFCHVAAHASYVTLALCQELLFAECRKEPAAELEARFYKPLGAMFRSDDKLRIYEHARFLVAKDYAQCSRSTGDAIPISPPTSCSSPSSSPSASAGSTAAESLPARWEAMAEQWRRESVKQGDVLRNVVIVTLGLAIGVATTLLLLKFCTGQ